MRKPKWTTKTWIEYLNHLLEIATGNEVSISKGNGKMGEIPSVSLPAILTCVFCKCMEKCYGVRCEKLRKEVRNSYIRNLNILNKNPESYWKQVKRAVALSRFFRFHVSGDIPTYEYLIKMVETAIENPHCDILCFTKRHGWINKYIRENGDDPRIAIPENLHILMSGWRDFPMDNPYKLPEAHVRFRDGYCEAREDAIECF